jgi:hypothetical protein
VAVVNSLLTYKKKTLKNDPGKLNTKTGGEKINIHNSVPTIPKTTDTD